MDIITPVFNAGEIVETCVRSVRDQGPGIEHYFQDGGSTDAITLTTLKRNCVNVVSQPDLGMYDALNLALNRGKGDIIGHLNADEQYLQGILPHVRSVFDVNPEVDVVCGDVVLTDASWNPQSYRRAVIPPRGAAGWIPLSVPTCSMFIRRRLFQMGLTYRSDLRAIADAFLVQDLIRMRAKWIFDRIPYAAFSIHRTNLSSSSAPVQDRQVLGLKINKVQQYRFRLESWFRKLQAGAYQFRDVNIAIFTPDSIVNRRILTAKRLGWHWPRP